MLLPQAFGHIVCRLLELNLPPSPESSLGSALLTVVKAFTKGPYRCVIPFSDRFWSHRLICRLSCLSWNVYV